MKRIISLSFLLAFTASCEYAPYDSYANPGDLESQIDVSSEQVNIGLSSKSALSDLSRLLNKDIPSRALLGCKASEIRCAQAQEILLGRNVSTIFHGDDNSVTLVYDRVTVRDCDNVYSEYGANHENVNHPAYACSIKTNALQMISDKRQITNPSLMDLPDAEKAVQTYDSYMRAPPTQTGGSGQSSVINAIGATSR